MKGHVDGHVDSSDVVTGIGPVFALELRTVMCTRIVAMIVDQDAVSRATERIMQPTPKVRRSRLTDGSVVQPAATMAATATKLTRIGLQFQFAEVEATSERRQPIR